MSLVAAETEASDLTSEPARRMTGGQALVAMLKRAGVDTIFGLPGIQLDGFFDALYDVRDEIKVIHPRHEQATAYMADGYARTTGRIGVCAVVPGPGLLNAAAALSTAYATNSPVLCITGQVQSDLIGAGRGALHEIPNQLEMIRSVTKRSERAMTPAEVPGVVARAIDALMTGRPRPVEIEIPPDILFAEGDVTLLAPRGERERPAPDPMQVARAAKALAEASFPIIFAGGGVQRGDATEELRELAELLSAPVVMSTNGKGSLSDRHPLALSVVAGWRIRERADVEFGVGTRFLDFKGNSPAARPGLTTLHLDIDAEELGRNFAPDVPLLGDVKTGLQALIDEIRRLNPPRHSREAELATIKAECRAAVDRAGPQAGFGNAIRAELPDDGILVEEVTQVAYWSDLGFPVYAPNTFIGPGYQGTLGFGFCTALGAKVGNPDRVVVSINGDGGFGYTMNELATMSQHEIGVVAIVFNDSAFGNVKRIQKHMLGGREIASTLKNPDFARLAEVHGIAGRKATTPDELRTELRASIVAGEPTVIEVPVGEMPRLYEQLGMR